MYYRRFGQDFSKLNGDQYSFSEDSLVQESAADNGLENEELAEQGLANKETATSRIAKDLADKKTTGDLVKERMRESCRENEGFIRLALREMCF